MQEVGDFSCIDPYKISMIVVKEENVSFKRYCARFFTWYSNRYLKKNAY